MVRYEFVVCTTFILRVFSLEEMYNTSLIINITWKQKKTSQRCLRFTLVAASVASISVCYCFPGKDPITQRCKMTPGKISQHMVRGCSHTLMRVNLAFAVSPLHRNPTLPYCTLLAPETQSPESLKVPASSFTNDAPVAGQWMEKLSATIVLAAIDKLFFYIQKMSGGRLPDKYSMTQASDLPRGTFTSFCT